MWNTSNGAGPSNRGRGQAYQPDEDTQRRVAILKIARRELEEEKRKKAADEDARVFQQTGVGESDSDEDSGGIRVPLPKSQQLSHDEVFIPPAVLRDRERAAKKAEENAFRSFPAHSFSGRNPYDDVVSIASSSNFSSNSRRRSRSRSPRSRGDSRRGREDSRDSRDSRSSRHKKSKKKKNRRRSSSSSSSSGESRDSRRRRDDSPSSVRTMRMPKQDNRNKYEFLDKNLNLWSSAAQFIVTHRKFDHDNRNLGCPRREISQMHLNVKYILGLEHLPHIFYRNYGQELGPQDRKFLNRSFAKELEEVAKHQPKETYFRKGGPIDGYWKVIQRSDILNEARDSGDVTDEMYQTEGVRSEIEQLKKAVKDNVHDIDSLIKYIDLEERNCKLDSRSFASMRPKDLADVILMKLEKSIKNNPKNAVLRVLKSEQMIKAEYSTEDVLREYQEATHKHPHDPMIWLSYLDYVQYDSNVFTVDRMKIAFMNCLKKTEALVNRTLTSHVHLITDLPAFREFHLSVYMRYLKWCFSTGCAPQAIANIQASMELNFGLNRNVPDRERWAVVKDPFWANALPRIGDIGGIGIGEFLKKEWKEESALELEREELQEFLRQSLDALNLVRNQNQRMEKNWVDFERRMQEVDARPKRVDYSEFEEFEGAKEELDEVVDFFYPVFHDDLTPYQAYSSVDVMDWTQPMLELLGVKFFHSPGCFTSTEQVISEWRRKDIFQEARPNFPETPSYTEKTSKIMGLRILSYVLAQRHEECKKETQRMDDQMMKYLLAGIETEAQSMENDGKLFYYQLKLKNMKSLLSSFKETTHAYVEVYELLRHALAMFAALKLTVWLERGVAEQKELATLEKNRERMPDEKKKGLENHTLLKRDCENLEKYRAGLWGYINNVSDTLEKPQKKELNDPTIPYANLQLLLYSKILLARQYVAGDRVAESVRQLLAGDIMQEEEDVITGLDANGKLYRQFIGTLKDWVELISKRDEREEEDGIPEFPRVGPLSYALLWAVEFVFLEQNMCPRKTINLVAQSLLEKFNEYDRNRKDHTRKETQKYRDRVDIQFLLDTLISLFSHKNFHVSHYEDYQNIIIRASETFTCETKYMLKLAELFSTSRLQSMKIKSRIEEKNRSLREKMRFQFDVQNERRLLMNTMTEMFVTMRISGRDTNPRAVYDSWKKEALTLRDPAVWRMVLKAAAVVNEKSVNETFVRANAQCSWAHNLHIDYVDLNPKKLETIIKLRNDTTEALLHNFFMQAENLETIYEIAGKPLADEENARDAELTVQNPMNQNQEDDIRVMEDQNPEKNPQNQNQQDEEEVKPDIESLRGEPPGSQTQKRREERQNREEERRRQEGHQSPQDPGRPPQNPQDEDVKPDIEKLQRPPGTLTQTRREERLNREEQDRRRRQEEGQNPEDEDVKPTREEVHREPGTLTEIRREARLIREEQERDRRQEEGQNGSAPRNQNQDDLREPKAEPM